MIEIKHGFLGFKAYMVEDGGAKKLLFQVTNKNDLLTELKQNYPTHEVRYVRDSLKIRKNMRGFVALG